MRRWQIPTADFEVFDGAEEALAYLRRARGPVVVKADGLAAGKGVVVAHTVDEAETAVADLMVRRVHGAAGARGGVGGGLPGEGGSVRARACGERVWALGPARALHRARDREC